MAKKRTSLDTLTLQSEEPVQAIVEKQNPPSVPPFQRGEGGFVNFTTRDGLVNDWVTAIHCATDGSLWFGTDGGVSQYHPNEGRFVNFTVHDGLV